MVTVGIEWCNLFPDPCDQNELSYCDETSLGFLIAMKNGGHFERFNWGDLNAWESDFRDPVFQGDDTHWIDHVDFAHFSSHGNTSNNVFEGNFGSNHSSCTWRSDKARLGNWDLEYLAIDACRSLELTQDIIAVWHNSFHGLHMIMGFTDLVSDAYSTSARGFWFGLFVSLGSKIANTWLDACYDYDFGNYPVAMAAGRTEFDAVNRRDNEALYSSSYFDDIPHSEVKWYAWKWRI